MTYKHLTIWGIALCIAGFGVFFACKSEYIEQDPVCFENDVRPIISSNCTQSGCHNAVDRESGRDYTTYEGIMRDVKAGDFRGSSLYSILVRPSGYMPPKPNALLSDVQIRTIATWIEQGATNDTCSVTSACDTTGTISYALQVKPILQNNCNGCHSGSSPQGGISYSAHAGVKETADNGTLVGSIAHQSGYSQMPKNGNQLSNCDIAKITKWVNAGALNN